MANSYSMTVQIEIGTDEEKKNAVRTAIVAQLTSAKAAGNIVSATWHVREVPITEGGSV